MTWGPRHPGQRPTPSSRRFRGSRQHPGVPARPPRTKPVTRATGSTTTPGGGGPSGTEIQHHEMAEDAANREDETV